ncbi:hypothetical protein Syun_008421 [Stephania yunnanensis]|uniref:Riboflavin synthase n=1 Tax=Stephania yunnanensis TaxID=152371 RepID=A0AAP0PN52_9MAGN
MGEIKHLGFSPSSSGGDGGFHITISATTVLSDVHLGDSIAVNGTCLTVTEFTPNSFTVNLAPETLRRTSLNDLKPGSLVNLERALLPSTRLGGHFVQGHVDGTGEIVEKRVEGDSLWVKVRVSDGDGDGDGGELMRFVVPKGYICVDGTSLTVVKVYDEEDCFDFMLVAYTQQKVVVASKGVGEKVNLEVDVLGKYVERILQRGGGGVGGDFKNFA